jgi:hypothetical protein
MEGDHFESLGVDGGIILKWVLKKYNLSVYTGFILVRIGTGMGNIAKC